MCYLQTLCDSMFSRLKQRHIKTNEEALFLMCFQRDNTLVKKDE